MRHVLSVLILVVLASPVVADDMVADDVAADDMAEAYEAYDGGDYATALAAWHRAAARGNTDAMTAIADLHLRGHGARLDAAAAVSWYRPRRGTGRCGRPAQPRRPVEPRRRGAA